MNWSLPIKVPKRPTRTLLKSAIVHPPASKLPMLCVAAGGISEFFAKKPGFSRRVSKTTRGIGSPIPHLTGENMKLTTLSSLAAIALYAALAQPASAQSQPDNTRNTHYQAFNLDIPLG